MIIGLIPQVQELVDSGRLHQFDGEWICKLPAEMQMAAAEKCMNGEPLTMMDDTSWSKNRVGASRSTTDEGI